MCAAIDGLPVTTAEKFEKLEAMVKRKFEMHGNIKEGVIVHSDLAAHLRCLVQCFVQLATCSASWLPPSCTAAGISWLRNIRQRCTHL